MILSFGSVNMDLVCEVEAIARPGETVLASTYATTFGGKGANQAVAAARIAGPGRVAMAGRIGDDPFGAACRRNLEAQGIEVDAICVADAPTGCAFIAVDRAGENAITVAGGANALLGADDVPGRLIGPRTIGLFQMEVPLDASLGVAARLRQAGGRVIWNLAPVPGALARDRLTAILDVTDHLVVNAGEAKAALACLGETSLDASTDSCRLAGLGDVTCIVTAGADGAYVATASGESWRSDSFAVRVVDTTGAGDTFVGILAALIDQDVRLDEAVRTACVGASLACRVMGAQTAMPTLAAIRSACPRP